MSQLCTRYSNLAISISLLLTSAPYAYATAIVQQSKTSIGNITIKEITTDENSAADQIYDKDISNSYIGKTQIERFKGTSPGDIFKGTVGVFSGETRNGGAIDPNIRGVQGQGRIPVTIDGTEQAITAYRGYYGANNRNYLDPNIIRSVDIEKGPSLSQNMRSSIGGGIAIKTININDVVKPDDNFGINVKTEVGNNAIKPRLAKLIYGEDYRDTTHDLFDRYTFNDKDINIRTHNRNEHVLHGINSYSYRVAVGFRQELFDFMLAYSHRTNGNFASGHRGAKGYSAPFTEQDRDSYSGKLGPDSAKYHPDPFLPFAANVYQPGHEVLNTSNTADTLLIKHNWRISDQQQLNFTLRKTQLYFGDIMPSRLANFAPENGLLPQWPEGQVVQQAGSINHKIRSEKYSALNLHSSIWFDNTDSKINTAGGFPRYPTEVDFMHQIQGIKNPHKDGSLIDSVSNHTHNNRWGIDLKNDFRLTRHNLLTLSARFQHEKMTNVNPYNSGYAVNTFWPPREGRRQEYHLGINYAWTPLERLTLNAGIQYNAYWSIDDFINKRRAAADTQVTPSPERISLSSKYQRLFTPQESEIYQRYQQLQKQNLSLFGQVRQQQAKLRAEKRSATTEEQHAIKAIKQQQQQISQETNNLQKQYSYINKSVQDKATGLNYHNINFIQLVDELTGQLNKQDNPFYTGEIDINQQQYDPISQQNIDIYKVAASAHQGKPLLDFTHKRGIINPKKPLSKRTAWDWAPVLSASLDLTDDWRMYLRYAETIRMPSLYEDTGNIAGQRYHKPKNQFKPERSKTVEIGSVYNLSQLLKTQHHADIKLTYYDMQIENVFERNYLSQTIQMDKQLISGIELQARYDNGLFFSDVSASYNLKTKVCDEDSYIAINMFNKLPIPNCIDGGYPAGFLRTSTPPKYSLYANIGLRLFDEKLTLGNRFIYHSKVVNKDEADLQKRLPSAFAGFSNNPLRWNPIFTVDAYMSYQITADTSVELVGSNMLDEYYLDPLTRSMMPAPGRTFKLSLSSQF